MKDHYTNISIVFITQTREPYKLTTTSNYNLDLVLEFDFECHTLELMTASFNESIREFL